MIDDETDHAIARLRAAIEGSRTTGYIECQMEAGRYLRKKAADLRPDIRHAVMVLAGDIIDGLHKEK